MGRAGGYDDGLLFVLCEAPRTEAGESRFDKPRLEQDAGGIAVAIKLVGHPERQECRVGITGTDDYPDDGGNPVGRRYCPPGSCFLDAFKSSTGCCAIAIKSAPREVKQEGFSRGLVALNAIVPHLDLAAQNTIIGDRRAMALGPSLWVAALPLLETAVFGGGCLYPTLGAGSSPTA